MVSRGEEHLSARDLDNLIFLNRNSSQVRKSSEESVASADGDNFAVTHAAADTASITAGTYSWAAQVVNGSTKYTVDQKPR